MLTSWIIRVFFERTERTKEHARPASFVNDFNDLQKISLEHGAPANLLILLANFERHDPTPPQPSKFCTTSRPLVPNRQNSNDFRGEEHTKNANDINDIQEISSVACELDSVVDP